MGIGFRKEIDNNPQSQTSPVFSYYLMTFDKSDITLQSGLAEDATTATLSSGHGFTGAAGETILIYENDHFLQQEVTVAQISGDVITLSTPVDNAFTSSAIVIRGNTNLAKDFSGANASDIVFSVLDGVIPIDINSVEILFQHAADSNDGNFGGIAALDNGAYFRQIDGRRVNFGNYKQNFDFRARGAEIVYNDKAPGTKYSTTIIFDTIETFGQVLRIDPRFDCEFLAHLRDNLSGNDLLNITLNGSYTSGE